VQALATASKAPPAKPGFNAFGLADVSFRPKAATCRRLNAFGLKAANNFGMNRGGAR
jgi:hypothetical protein